MNKVRGCMTPKTLMKATSNSFWNDKRGKDVISWKWSSVAIMTMYRGVFVTVVIGDTTLMKLLHRMKVKKKNWWKRLHDPQVKHSYSCKWEVYSDWCKVQWRPPFGRCSVLTWGDRTGDEYNEIRPFCAMLMFCSAFWMCLLSWTWLWKQDAIQQYNMINDECGMVWLVMVNSHDNYCSIVRKSVTPPNSFPVVSTKCAV